MTNSSTAPVSTRLAVRSAAGLLGLMGLMGLVGLVGLAVAPAARATDVGVSVQVGQPGFYGRIDIGNAPPPVVLAEPVWVRRQPAPMAPVYMRIPPGHQKHWDKHCARYNACGVPVYFVREDWYQERYAQRPQDGGEPGRGQGNGHGKGHGNGRGKDKGRD